MRGDSKQMNKLSPDTAKEMLGVYLAPDGNNMQQKLIMTEKMNKFSEYIRTGHVTRHEAWICLNMITLKSLVYALPAMTLTEKEYKEIMKPVFRQFLPKIGINSNIKRELVYFPLNVQGLNITNPYILQGTAHIKDICEHVWKASLTGQLIKTNLKHLRIELGTNKIIFNQNFESYKELALTSSYVRDTWQFSSQYGITFDDKTVTTVKKRDVIKLT